MKNIYNNLKAPVNENSASIVKMIRPGSDEYNEVHDVTHKSDKLSEYEDICDSILSDDDSINIFISTFINKVNEKLITGKGIPSKAYKIYNVFRCS